MRPTLFETMRLVVQAHAGQVDKMGLPYWRHPMRVMMRLKRLSIDRVLHVALLHDVLEDTDLTMTDLLVAGYGMDVVQPVNILTRDPNMTYRAHISKIIGSRSLNAMLVKYADLMDNLSPERAAGLSDSHRRRYEWAVRMLRDELDGWALDNIIEGEVLVVSPCVGLCNASGQGYCAGCLRTRADIAAWGGMSNGQRWLAIEGLLNG